MTQKKSSRSGLIKNFLLVVFVPVTGDSSQIPPLGQTAAQQECPNQSPKNEAAIVQCFKIHTASICLCQIKRMWLNPYWKGPDESSYPQRETKELKWTPLDCSNYFHIYCWMTVPLFGTPFHVFMPIEHSLLLPWSQFHTLQLTAFPYISRRSNWTLMLPTVWPAPRIEPHIFTLLVVFARGLPITALPTRPLTSLGIFVSTHYPKLWPT